MSTEFLHRPVLREEVLRALRPGPGGRQYADGTLGAGGHAEAVLEASAPDGRLVGCDRDGEALAAASARLEPYGSRVELRRGAYETLDEWVGRGSCAGVLLDLGVSSPQLDCAGRGFSFREDGPLDMRMDVRQTVTAADLVNGASEAELADWFWKLGDERHARRLARVVVAERRLGAFGSTLQLARLIERVQPRHGQRLHPATKVFQALRMAVNDEVGQLERGLPRVWELVAPGGRLAVITFHSVEDRIVKGFGRELARDYSFPGDVDVPELRVSRAPRALRVTRKSIEASPSEVAANPRARSARLRVLEKL